MMNRTAIAFLVVAPLLACSDPVPKTDTTAVSSQAVAPAGFATCSTDADCVGKPAKPNVQMCMKGASVQISCRAGVCAAGCKQTACAADGDCPTGTTCKNAACTATAPAAP